MDAGYVGRYGFSFLEVKAMETAMESEDGGVATSLMGICECHPDLVRVGISAID